MTSSHNAPLEVVLDSGCIRGTRTKTARQFRGVRYAAAPVGGRRWRMPQPVEPWAGIADAALPGPVCPQRGPLAAYADEDCLFVNVTTPRRLSGEPLPVMVWLHGGGFTTGAGDAYDAQRLAHRGNAVVITVNYRLGVFGYFGYPGVAGSGNFGLADQLAALLWTQRNAAAFGGDPDNVTVFGQSAGAMSIGALLTSPAATGLFHKAIMQSGAPTLYWPRGVMFPSSPEHTPYMALSDVEKSGTRLAEQLGCSGTDTMERLREVSTEELVAHTDEFANHLAHDTPLLPRHPADAVRRGDVHRVPVISGITRDEMRPFIGGASLLNPITAERFTTLLTRSFGDDAPLVAGEYPLAQHSSAAMAWATIATDVSWAHDVQTTNELLARHAHVYAYEFADRSAPNVNGLEIPDLPMGAAHASDLPYLFDLGGAKILAPEQEELADTMIELWTSFALTGTPAHKGHPSWTPFNESMTVLRLDKHGIHPAPFRSEHHYDFWCSIQAMAPSR